MQLNDLKGGTAFAIVSAEGGRMKNVVVSFPEDRMKKVKKKQNAGAKQAAVSLSLVSLILGALLLNDSLIRDQKPIYIVSDNTSGSDIKNLNRAIANAQPLNPFRDLEWEKKMAEKLGTDKIEERTPASLGKQVSTIEQLRFGPLAGKYHVIDRSSDRQTQIQEISYVESSEVNDRPVYLDPAQFLKTYGNLLAVEFSQFDRANTEQNQIQEYNLLSDSKKVVGTAAFMLDEDGRFISLKVRSAAAH